MVSLGPNELNTVLYTEEYLSDFELTKDNPYLTLASDLWEVAESASGISGKLIVL